MIIIIILIIVIVIIIVLIIISNESLTGECLAKGVFLLLFLNILPKEFLTIE